HLVALRHPRFKLPGTRHHVLNASSPSAALDPIKNDIGDSNLSLLGLTSSLEHNRSDHVVTILGVEMRNDLSIRSDGPDTVDFRFLRSWQALWRRTERGMKRCRAT